ncbi:MAG: FCD domain-containing protein, partial [Comamonadaceae bacterium]
EFSFHRVINRLADASKLSWFLLSATRYTPVQFYSSDPAWGESAVESHRRLIAALADGKADVVGAENKAHFVDGAQRLIAHLDDVGIWD